MDRVYTEYDFNNQASPNYENRTVMIIDDELDITTPIKILLEDNGFRVTVYNDPQLALQNFRPSLYDLVLIDVKMKKEENAMAGLELYENFKHTDRDCRICFFTAAVESSKELKEIDPEFDEKYFIQKPIEIQDLVKRISSVLLGK